jgi:hypothetical protein
LHKEEGAQECFGRRDGWIRLSEEGHARTTKVSVCVGYPVVDRAWRNARTATLRLCLDQRAKIS